MDCQSLRVLEFPQIQKLLELLAATEPGRRAAREVYPNTDRRQIELWLRQVTELKEHLQLSTSLPLSGIVAIGCLIERAAESGQVFLPAELLQVESTLEATRSLLELGQQCRPRHPNLADLFENLEPVPELEAKIRRAIDRRGLLRDGASPQLARIRQEIAQFRKRLHEELTEILERQASQKTLQEKLISIRNDRFVIPLRSDARGALEGIVHDTSQSGATSFVEPLSVVPLNNRLSQARSQEREEEARILRELTDAVLTAAEPLRCNERWLGSIDCVHAKALFSALLQAREPKVNSGEKIRLLQASHPILVLQERAQHSSTLPAALREMVLESEFSESSNTTQIEVVPIDLQLDQDCKTLIISGANTGGKTVSLKTLGLLGAMVQAGLHIPAAEGSEWPVLGGIFAAIGDEQDVRAHLSTFSARFQRLASILKQVDSRSLILLDEIGTGTDPAEGAALALAVLDELRRPEPFIAVTTHYHLVKAYGILREGVENVSVAFDDKSGRPTYRLLYGYPGTSNALQIASDLGMPLGVVEAARGHLDPDEARTVDLIQQLGITREKIEREREGLRVQRQQLDQTRAEFLREQERFAQSRETILNEFRKKAETHLSQAEEELKSAIARFQQRGMRGAMVAREKVQQVREELNTVLESRSRYKWGTGQAVAAGQAVRLRDVPGIGTVRRIKEHGRRAEVQIGQKKVEVDTDALEFLPREHSESTCLDGTHGIRVFRDESEGCQQRLHLVGLRVEEAIPLLDKTIDRAILEGLNRIEVIHGHGTGRLRKAVQAFLAEHGEVEGFHLEAQSRGGSGVTVVELKD